MKYKIDDEVLVKCKIRRFDSSDETYLTKVGNWGMQWFPETAILGLAADLLPKREPQVGDWVDFDCDEASGIGRIAEVKEEKVIVNVWGDYWFVKKSRIVLREPPTNEQLWEMVNKGNG